MIYFLLLALQLLILWRLSYAVNTRLLSRLSVRLYALLYLPGTFMHELAHYVTAKALGVHVGRFSVTPARAGNEVVLGSVSIAKTGALKRLAIGVAPMFFGLCTLVAIVSLAVHFQIYTNWKWSIVLVYLVFIIANSMFSSKKDLEGLLVPIVVGVAIMAGLYYLGLRVHISLPDNNIPEVLKLVNYYMLVPIVLNLALILLARAFR